MFKFLVALTIILIVGTIAWGLYDVVWPQTRATIAPLQLSDDIITQSLARELTYDRAPIKVLVYGGVGLVLAALWVAYFLWYKPKTKQTS